MTDLRRPSGPTPDLLKCPLVQGEAVFSSKVAPQPGMKNSSEKEPSLRERPLQDKTHELGWRLSK